MGFHNGKSNKRLPSKGYLKWLPEIDNVGSCEPHGKKSTCQVCDYIIKSSTFTAKACVKMWPLKCISEGVLYLLRRKVFDDTPYVGEAKTKFRLGLNNYGRKQRSFKKVKQSVSQKRFYSHYIQNCHWGIDGWEVTLFENIKHIKNLKEEDFSDNKLKMLCTLGLNVLIKHNT